MSFPQNESASIAGRFSRPALREVPYFVLSALGALLYVASGSAFAIHEVRCVNWPPDATGWTAAALYGAGLAAMGAAWLGLVARTATGAPAPGAFARSLIAAILVHAIVLAAPPFLSDDTLAYGAIGALAGLHGLPAESPLGALPEGDAYRLMISQYPAWLSSPSTYGPLFNWLATLVVTIAGDNVLVCLRLFQLLASLAVVATALIASAAARDWCRNDPRRGDAAAMRLTSLRLVMFSPLALVEATGNGHNDALLALVVAAFALAIVNSRHAAGPALLAAGLLVKLSVLVPLGFYMAHWIARAMSGFPRSKRVLAAVGAALAAGILFWVVIPYLGGTAGTVVRLFAPAADGAPFCTRALECPPRWLFHFVLGWPDAAWLIGLVFRFGGLALLVSLAWRNRRLADPLPALACFILFYYLFFHAYMQAWYLLALLPLIVFLAAPLRPVAYAFILASLAQYGLDFAWACSKAMPWVIVRELGGVMIVLVPPLIALARAHAASTSLPAGRRSTPRQQP
ncbi:MAG: hypothetical protein KKH72_02560 [Alphaproteobacteria bacterium]|nr:hypothetical protein [Alphaproteobacteria bacterium]